MSPSTRDNAEVVRRYAVEFGWGRQADILQDIVSEDVVFHNPGGGELRGIAAVRQMAARVSGAFENVSGVIDDLVVNGDRVMLRATETGTHIGEYFGVPATGRRVSWWWWAIFRVQDGKIVERWALVDRLGILQALGASVCPAPTAEEK